MRGGHGSAVELVEESAGDRAEDGGAGCGEVDVGRAVVREGRQRVVLLARGDADDVLDGVVAGITGLGVVVRGLVPGREDEKRPGTILDRVADEGVGRGRAEAAVHDLRSLRAGVAKRLLDREAAERVIAGTKRHHLHAPVHAGDTDGVVALRADRSGYV